MSEKVGSLPIKLFAGTVCGTSISLVFISIVWLAWFIPLGRPGSHIPSVEQIIQEWTAANNTGGRSDEELKVAAANTQSAYIWASRIVYKPVEIVMLTSACLVAAWFAAFYARMQDQGDGVSTGGSLFLPSVVGTVVGGAVMWFLIYALLVLPAGEGHGSHGDKDHGVAAAAHDAKKNHAEAKGHEEHKEHAESKAGHEAAIGAEHAAEPASINAWLAHNETLAEILMYFGAMIATCVAAVMTPRGAAAPKPETMTLNGHGH